MRMWHIYNTCKTLYIGVELLLQLEIVVIVKYIVVKLETTNHAK